MVSKCWGVVAWAIGLAVAIGSVAGAVQARETLVWLLRQPLAPQVEVTLKGLDEDGDGVADVMRGTLSDPDTALEVAVAAAAKGASAQLVLRRTGQDPSEFSLRFLDTSANGRWDRSDTKRGTLTQAQSPEASLTCEVPLVKPCASPFARALDEQAARTLALAVNRFNEGDFVSSGMLWYLTGFLYLSNGRVRQAASALGSAATDFFSAGLNEIGWGVQALARAIKALGLGGPGGAPADVKLIP